jgi:hypothetical protein
VADKPDWSEAQSGLIGNAFLSGVGLGTSFNVSRYNSVQVTLQNLNGTTPLCCVYRIMDVTGTVIDEGLLSADLLTGAPTWTLPCNADSLILLNNTGSQLIGRVVGSTVTRPRRLQHDMYPVRQFSGVVASGTPNGTLTQLTGTDSATAVAFPNLSSFNGQIATILHVTALNGATSFIFIAGFLDDTGTRQYRRIGTLNSAVDVAMTFGHPFAFTSWWVQNIGATTGGVTASLIIFPAQAD